MKIINLATFQEVTANDIPMAPFKAMIVHSADANGYADTYEIKMVDPELCEKLLSSGAV
jgi:hypothetical protein